jgi:hypothetical protein
VVPIGGSGWGRGTGWQLTTPTTTAATVATTAPPTEASLIRSRRRARRSILVRMAFSGSGPNRT